MKDEYQIHNKYIQLLDSIVGIINESESRITSETPDILFIDNANFFVKSYLITICTYLESYLKDIAYCRITNIANDLLITKIPQNIIKWQLSDLSKELKEKDLKYESLKLSIKKKDLNDHISGNPYRTVDLFQKIGIDLNSVEEFAKRKDLVNSIIVKRNNIIHHNDNASDVSTSDLINYINEIKKYMDCITHTVSDHNHAT